MIIFIIIVNIIGKLKKLMKLQKIKKKLLYKTTGEYYICNIHLPECEKFEKVYNDNTIELDKEINNYKEFKELLINYLVFIQLLVILNLE